MNVVEVLPSISSESGGPVRSTLANCRALHRADADIRLTLATTAQGLNVAWRESFEAQIPPGMDLVVVPAVGRHAFSFSPHLAAWLHGNVAKYDLLVVRALFHPISTAAAWIARRQRVPYLLVPHGTLSRYTFAHRRTLLKHAYFGLVERRTLAWAAAVRFTCQAEREESPPCGVGTLTRVIPHPYEPRFGPADRRDGKRRQILFLSRLDPKKGLDVLLEAMRQVLAQVSGVRLVLAGSGPAAFERRLRSEIRRLGLENGVALPGFVEGEVKARLLTESAVFVLPSRQENFGIAVVEAMDAGLPVVISRGVGIWPEVQAAGAGLVVDGPTPETLAAALSRLLTDEALRHKMGRKGCDLVATAFNPETVGRQLSELYRAAAENPQRVRETLS